MATDISRISEQGVATLPEQAWEHVRRRAEIIGPLAQFEPVGHAAPTRRPRRSTCPGDRSMP